MLVTTNSLISLLFCSILIAIYNLDTDLKLFFSRGSQLVIFLQTFHSGSFDKFQYFIALLLWLNYEYDIISFLRV